MITKQEQLQHIEAIVEACGYGVEVEAGDVVCTMETMEDFLSRFANSSVEEVEDDDGEVIGECIELPHVQPNGKGTPRGTMFVVDFSDYRATYFVEG